MRKKADLTNIPVFENLIQFDVEGENIDLHNDFDCTKIETDPFTRQVMLHFESPTRYFRLVFFEARIFHFRLLPFPEQDGRKLVFDNFSRIDAITNKEHNYQKLPETAQFYSVDFTDEVSLVIEAEKVILLESSKQDLDLLRSLEMQAGDLQIRVTDLKTRLTDTPDHDGSALKTLLIDRREKKEELAELENQLIIMREQINKLQIADRQM